MKLKMVNEMLKLREMLNKEGITWKDASDRHLIMNDKDYIIYRTHFVYNNFFYSVIFCNGSHGANEELLECMRKDISRPNEYEEPLGSLTADEIYKWIIYGKNPKESTYGIVLHDDKHKILDYVEIKAINAEQAQKLAFDKYIKNLKLRATITTIRKDEKNENFRANQFI